MWSKYHDITDFATLNFSLFLPEFSVTEPQKFNNVFNVSKNQRPIALILLQISLQCETIEHGQCSMKDYYIFFKYKA